MPALRTPRSASSRWTFHALSALALATLAACGGSGGGGFPILPAPAPGPAPAPAPAPEPTPKTLSLSLLGRHETGIFEQSAAEIPAFDAASKRAFVVNAQKGMLDVIDLSNPAAPRHIGEIRTQTLRAGAEANSVAVSHGIVAVAVQSAVKTDAGFVALYGASDLSLIGQAPVGALPDMLTFTPDGKTLLVANEGEPSDDYQIDPEGSVSVIDVSDPKKPAVRTADFKAWNGKEAELRVQGVRIFGPRASAAQDLEPEYITVSADGKGPVYGLKLSLDMSLADAESRATTADLLKSATAAIRNAYREMADIANGVKANASTTTGNTTGTAPAYLTNQIANYQAALDRLTGG